VSCGFSSSRPFDEREEEMRLIEYRVAEIENQIGAGLLEEVVQVAQGENLLASVMVENKV
jgi:NADH dehydrogenase (ubiquinone) 1 alpha subcomplex subunit 5